MVNWIPIIGIIIALVFIVAIIIVIVSINTTSEADRPTVPVSNKCQRQFDDLVNVSGEPCCLIGGEPTAFKFVKTLNLVVSPVPFFYLDACKGFCQNAKIDSKGAACQSGSSKAFLQCVNLTKPQNCTDAGMPVAHVGTQFYYAHSATDAECKTTGNCG